jgi:hypothetical protein
MENVDLNKVLLVTCIGPQCLWVHVWNMWHDWGTPWKIGSLTMLGLVYQLHISWGNINNTTLTKISLENHGLLLILSSHMYIHNTVDLYASLEYKNHKDVAMFGWMQIL